MRDGGPARRSGIFLSAIGRFRVTTIQLQSSQSGPRLTDSRFPCHWSEYHRGARSQCVFLDCHGSPGFTSWCGATTSHQRWRRSQPCCWRRAPSRLPSPAGNAGTRSSSLSGPCSCGSLPTPLLYEFGPCSRWASASLSWCSPRPRHLSCCCILWLLWKKSPRAILVVIAIAGIVIATLPVLRLTLHILR